MRPLVHLLLRFRFEQLFLRHHPVVLDRSHRFFNHLFHVVGFLLSELLFDSYWLRRFGGLLGREFEQFVYDGELHVMADCFYVLAWRHKCAHFASALVFDQFVLQLLSIPLNAHQLVPFDLLGDL